MRIEIIRKGSVVHCKVYGELDHHSAKNMRNAIDGEVLKKHTEHLLLDFSRLDFMDSSGIGVIMGRYKLLNEIGGEIYICGCNESIKKVIALAGLSRFVKFVKSEKDLKLA